jgi:predicted amidohydrolase YtcJ
LSDGLLVVGVDVDGERTDVRCGGGVVTAIGTDLAPRRGETVVRGAAAAVPGLHDHHLHLMAMAARADSVDVGPERVSGDDDLTRVLAGAGAALAPGEWLRAVGYHERFLGPLDRWVLDRIVDDRPLRVQHRSGHLWVLNSAGCRAVGLDDADPAAGGRRDGTGADGIERDGAGRATGRLVDRDRWLAERLPRRMPPDLGPVGSRLASYGVTGVTDATPTGSAADLEGLAAARRSGALVQRVRVMGSLAPDDPGVPDGLEVGPVKVMVADGRDPDVDRLAERIDGAHRSGRPVALHCVSLVAAAVALAAWDSAGVRPGDRMEHGAVLPPDVVRRLAGLGVTVVTQPAFLFDRGDDYLAEVDADDRAHLYRCAGLERAGVGVGAGTDAPFGPEDPWVAIASAVRRSTRSGRVVGPDERVAPLRALGLFLSDPADPGGPPRTVAVGARADLCLLGDDLRRTLDDPLARRVVATVVGGRVVHEG